MKFPKFTQGCIIHPILKTFAAAALSLCLLGSSAAQATDISDTTHAQNRSSAATSVSIHSGTKWEVRAGDTLAGIARSIYPDNAPMRDKLIRAIIAANPDISTSRKPAQVIVGSVLILPDLRTLSASEIPSTKAPTDKPKSISIDKAVPPIVPALPVTAAVSKRIKPAAESPPLPTALQKQTAPDKLTTGDGFRLKLSSGVMNLSAIGKLSGEELKRRREGQLLLDADDPIENFLTLKRQIKHLETRVEELQLKLDLGKNRASLPVAATAPATSPVAKSAAPSPASVSSIPAAYLSAPSNDTLALIKYALTLYLLPAAEITLALLALFFVLRYYRNLRNQLAESGELATAARSKRLSILAKAREATADISNFDKNVAISTAANIQIVEDTGVDVILQDAQLFVIHGYPDKAIELLEDQLAINHEEVRVWMLLFVILRSQGMKEDFEKFAQRFRTLIPVQSMWENIQDLGRELEPANALYLNKRNRRVTADIANTSPPSTPTAALFPGIAAITDTPIDFSVSTTRSPDDTQDFAAPFREVPAIADTPVNFSAASTRPPHDTQDFAAPFREVPAIADTSVDVAAAAARSPDDTQDLTVLLNPTKK